MNFYIRSPMDVVKNKLLKAIQRKKRGLPSPLSAAPGPEKTSVSEQ